MTRTTGANGIAILKNAETCRLVAYRDASGIPTIGWGHTSAAGAPEVHDGMQITQAEADVILHQDLATSEAAVNRLVTVATSQNQFDALVSLVYNIGPGNLEKSLLLRDLNAGDAAGAQAQFGRWTRAGGKVLKGLVTRRAREAALFGTPDAPAAARPAATAAAPAAPTAHGFPNLFDLFDTVGAVLGPIVGSFDHPAASPGASDAKPTEGQSMGALTTISSLFSLVSTFGPMIPEIVAEVPDIEQKAKKLATDVKALDVTASIADLEALVAAVELPFHVITKTVQASHTMTAPAKA